MFTLSLSAVPFLFIVSAYAQGSGEGCLTGRYYFDKEEMASGAEPDNKKVPVKALSFSATPEGDCSVSFFLRDSPAAFPSIFSATYTREGSTRLKIDSHERVPDSYLRLYFTLASPQTLSELTYSPQDQSVTMYWYLRTTHYSFDD
ncbi:hypothetical protein FOZ61_004741 [Perkinsus olseni]|uniref:Uncharacterized protein n=1 Tax=Perkinsus olseni TaxID=32597 RepID=A0A7J6LKK7_PEROL|nr:hypothetical protein FOZ61_004741 [Perkinsus olseni]